MSIFDQINPVNRFKDLMGGGKDPGKGQYNQVMSIFKQAQGQQAQAQANALQQQQKALGAIKGGYKNALASAGNTAYAAKKSVLGRETQNLGTMRAGLESSGLQDTTLGANLSRAVYSDTNTNLGQIDSALSQILSGLQSEQAQLEAGIYGNTASMFGAFGAQNAGLSSNIANAVAGVQYENPNAWLSSLFSMGGNVLGRGGV